MTENSVQLNLNLKEEKNFYNMFLNDKFFGRIHKKIAEELKLTKLNVLTIKTMELLKNILKKQCLNKAIQLLTIRDHSTLELVEKLKKTANLKIINQTIEELKNLNYLNDTNFATNLAKKLIIKKGLSKKRTIFELKLKGIDSQTAENVIANLQINTNQNIINMIKKKYEIKQINNLKTKQKIIRYFMQKGHSYEDIQTAIKSILNNSKDY